MWVEIGYMLWLMVTQAIVSEPPRMWPNGEIIALVNLCTFRYARCTCPIVKLL